MKEPTNKKPDALVSFMVDFYMEIRDLNKTLKSLKRTLSGEEARDMVMNKVIDNIFETYPDFEAKSDEERMVIIKTMLDNMEKEF